MIRRRRMSPAEYRPLELNPYPTRGLPSTITSLTTATIEQSIELKSIQAFRIDELMGTIPSCTETIFIVSSKACNL